MHIWYFRDYDLSLLLKESKLDNSKNSQRTDKIICVIALLQGDNLHYTGTNRNYQISA